MTNPVSFTLDLEDLRTSPLQELRFPTLTHRVLELLDEHSVTASIYVVGDLVEDHPGLIRHIAEAGHELGLHSWRHVPLTALDPATLREELKRGRDALEAVSGRPVTGYRAPMMSLVPDTAWALDILAETGFTYSSSVLPAPSALFGWPGLPRRPFLWHNGLVEFPCPVVSLGPVTIPFLGGTYLRVLPGAVRRLGLARASADEVLWAYCHPWEFDPDEHFYRYAHTSWLTSRIGWVNRRGMTRRVAKVLRNGAGAPLGDLVDTLDRDTLPRVDATVAANAAPPPSDSRISRLFRSPTSAPTTDEASASHAPR